MSLLAALPTPARIHQPALLPSPAPVTSSSNAIVSTKTEAPPYLRRQRFIPRRQEDFGDGGAFPEIHVAQYPLEMGRSDPNAGGKTLAVTINSDGQLNYDAIVKQGANRNKIVHSDHKALVPKVDMLEKSLARPDDEEVQKTAKETMAALQLVVEKKLAVTNPSALPRQPGEAQTIKYTPSQKGAQYNSGASTRTVKLYEQQVDPLEPPKFRHVKVPRGAGSPPVPVMHSPPRPLTGKDMQDWKIPPCVSNWKNAKGYTIPLDKRLAADGRGLQESTINDKFAHLSEALYIAEQKAREAIEMRAKIQKELLTKEREKKEQELRQLALKARMERMGGIASRADPTAGGVGGGGFGADDDLPPPPPPPQYHETPEEREERRRRDELREERRRERERERRLEAKDAHGGKKSKLTRDRDRDVGEKIALGMANVGAAGEVMYDSRLFNQDAGMNSGFVAEDSYHLYDKPLFTDRSALYRTGKKTTADEEDEGAEPQGTRSDRFKPDKGFQGADATGGSRSRPVEFERHAEEADPFGLDQFLTEVKGKKRGALDGVGAGGGMRAAAGGSSVDEFGSGSGRRMQFTSGRQ